MLFMDYPSIIGEDFPDYDKQDNWKLVHAYIYTYRKRLIYEYTGNGFQAITILKSLCANMNFSDKSR